MIRFTWGLAVAVVCFSIALAQAEPRGGGRSRDEGRDTEGREGNQDRDRDGNQDRLREGNQDHGRENSLQNQRGEGRGNVGRTDSLDGLRNNERPSNLRPGNLPGRGLENGPAAQWNRLPATNGEAVGAAAINRNQPQFYGAQGEFPGAQRAAGAAAANRNSPEFDGAQGAAWGAAAARRNQPLYPLNTAGFYNPAWYGAHPNAWAPAAWAVGTAWQPVDWITIASACGYVGVAPAYDPAALSYNQVADVIANNSWANASANDEWLPLGVFAVSRDGQQPQYLVQLGINRQGVLRGNSTDAGGNQTLPIQGAVDKKTLAACWTVGSDTQTVMEAGLADLSRGEAQAVLYRNGSAENWLLVRMTQP